MIEFDGEYQVVGYDGVAFTLTNENSTIESAVVAGVNGWAIMEDTLIYCVLDIFLTSKIRFSWFWLE